MPTSTITELASKLEAAVEALTARKAVVDGLKADLAKAQAEFNDAAGAAQEARSAYLKYVDNLLSLGGTVHR